MVFANPNFFCRPGNEEKERLRRLKDMKMKQAEMEAEGRLKRKVCSGFFLNNT